MTSTPIGKQKRKSQPRVVKRRPKPFPLLTVPRNEANEACLSLLFLCVIFSVAVLKLDPTVAAKWRENYQFMPMGSKVGHEQSMGTGKIEEALEALQPPSTMSASTPTPAQRTHTALAGLES